MQILLTLPKFIVRHSISTFCTLNSTWHFPHILSILLNNSCLINRTCLVFIIMLHHEFMSFDKHDIFLVLETALPPFVIPPNFPFSLIKCFYCIFEWKFFLSCLLLLISLIRTRISNYVFFWIWSVIIISLLILSFQFVELDTNRRFFKMIKVAHVWRMSVPSIQFTKSKVLCFPEVSMKVLHIGIIFNTGYLNIELHLI